MADTLTAAESRAITEAIYAKMWEPPDAETQKEIDALLEWERAKCRESFAEMRKAGLPLRILPYPPEGRTMAELKKRTGTKVTQADPKVEYFDHPLANCKPRGDRVVVRRDVVKKKSEGGILLPDSVTSGQKQQLGTVWKVGPGNYDKDGNRQALDLKKGDRVIITGWAGLEIKDPTASSSASDEFIILREEDILAVLED